MQESHRENWLHEGFSGKLPGAIYNVSVPLESLMPVRIGQVAVPLCLLLASLVSPLAFGQEKPALEKTASLITIESGNLPIILSAPHGGGDANPSATERQGEGVERFNPRSDSNTDRVVSRVIAE